MSKKNPEVKSEQSEHAMPEAIAASVDGRQLGRRARVYGTSWHKEAKDLSREIRIAFDIARLKDDGWIHEVGHGRYKGDLVGVIGDLEARRYTTDDASRRRLESSSSDLLLIHVASKHPDHPDADVPAMPQEATGVMKAIMVGRMRTSVWGMVRHDRNLRVTDKLAIALDTAGLDRNKLMHDLMRCPGYLDLAGALTWDEAWVYAIDNSDREKLAALSPRPDFIVVQSQEI